VSLGKMMKRFSYESFNMASRASPFLQRVQEMRRKCGAIVNHDAVQHFILLLIVVNAIMMGISTFDFVMKNPRLDSTFEQVDNAFLIIFTFELFLHFVAIGMKLFINGWLLFDFLVVVFSWSLSSMQIVRAFRIFRALRLVTRIKVMKDMVLAVLSVMPRMYAIALLLTLIFYIFGVMLTQLFQDMYERGETEFNYFGSLDITLFTLFQMMTMDGWAGISQQVIDQYFWAWIPFSAFVISSGFIIVNLIIAVICDAVATLNKDTKAKIVGEFDENDSQVSSSESKTLEQIHLLEQQISELSLAQDRLIEILRDKVCKKQTSLINSMQNPDL
jgi:Ion transport protein